MTSFNIQKYINLEKIKVLISTAHTDATKNQLVAIRTNHVALTAGINCNVRISLTSSHASRGKTMSSAKHLEFPLERNFHQRD